MEFLFWQPSVVQRRRMMPTTLENLHGGCGFSGTDASMLEIASGLCASGHGVRVLSGGPAVRPPQNRSVRYLSPERSFLDEPAQQADLARIDVFVVVYMMPEAPAHAEMMDVLRRLTNPRLKVFCWCHLIFQDSHIALLKNACQHRGAPLTLVCVSEFVRRHLRVDGSSMVTIPNAINPLIFDRAAVDGRREPRSLVFCASFERGGRVAQEVHALLGRTHTMGGLHVSSYCDSGKGPSLSKRALSDLMRRCDYMVYPLVLDSGWVHHDTYSCVVLEAMACGVLVVSWDVACLRGVFGDLITLLPPPAAAGYDAHAPGGTNAAMLEPPAVSALADAVASLMALPDAVRESRRDAARSWALAQTWDVRVQALLRAIV